MYNLMISEIFMAKKIQSSRTVFSRMQTAKVNDFQSQVEDSDYMQDEPIFYNGIYEPDCFHLYQTIRNLYSLSLRNDIIVLISNI